LIARVWLGRMTLQTFRYSMIGWLVGKSPGSPDPERNPTKTKSRRGFDMARRIVRPQDRGALVIRWRNGADPPSALANDDVCNRTPHHRVRSSRRSSSLFFFTAAIVRPQLVFLRDLVANRVDVAVANDSGQFIDKVPGRLNPPPDDSYQRQKFLGVGCRVRDRFSPGQIFPLAKYRRVRR